LGNLKTHELGDNNINFAKLCVDGNNDDVHGNVIINKKCVCVSFFLYVYVFLCLCGSMCLCL
jgi:hypothetical protein